MTPILGQGVVDLAGALGVTVIRGLKVLEFLSAMSFCMSEF